MIMSVWEPWLSVLVCHVPDLIRIKSTFLSLIPQPGTDPRIRYSKWAEKIRGSTHQENAHLNYGRCSSSWCSYLKQAVFMFFKSVRVELFHKYDLAETPSFLEEFSFVPQIGFNGRLHWSDWVTLRPLLVFVLVCSRMLLCHAGGPCVAVHCCWPADVSNVVYLALLLQTSRTCWGSVWPVVVVMSGPVDCPKK